MTALTASRGVGFDSFGILVVGVLCGQVSIEKTSETKEADSVGRRHLSECGSRPCTPVKRETGALYAARIVLKLLTVVQVNQGQGELGSRRRCVGILGLLRTEFVRKRGTGAYLIDLLSCHSL